MCEVVGGCNGDVCGRMSGHDCGGGEPREGVGDAFGVRAPGPHAIAAIMACRWPEIPTFDGVRCPSATDVRFFVDEHFSARWGEGRSVKVESAVHVGLGRELRVDA
jgi:hypothetical protein